MSEKKPPLVAPLRERPLCPICGKASYSLAGMHPQCAVVHADRSVQVREKAKKPVAAPARPFSKRCPRCGRTVPSRRMVCDCGRSFAPSVPGGSASTPLSAIAEIPDRTINQQVARKLTHRGITVHTQRGAVTLSGVVQFPHQKSAAVQAANSVKGVRRVIDNTKVKAATSR